MQRKVRFADLEAHPRGKLAVVDILHLLRPGSFSEGFCHLPLAAEHLQKVPVLKCAWPRSSLLRCRREQSSFRSSFHLVRNQVAPSYEQDQ